MRLLSLILVLASIVVAELPEWAVNPPQGSANAYILGIGYSDRDPALAVANALENGLRKIIEKKGIKVDPASFRYDRTDSQVTIHSTLSYQTQRTDLDHFQVVEEYLEEGTGKGNVGYVLLRYPSLTPQYAPSLTVPLMESVVAPGWGHSSIGEKRKGTRFLLGSGAILVGALGSFLASNQFRGKASDARTAATIKYYNDQSRLFGNVAVGLSITYGILGAYSVFDVSSSKYLKGYL